MSKTDHKKMWRKVRKENVFLFNEMQRWERIAKEQGNILKDIRDGKIDMSEIIIPAKKVKPSKELLKAIDQGKKRMKETEDNEEKS